MTEKLLTLTALTFSVGKETVAHGILIREPQCEDGQSASELFSGKTMQMGTLRREKGFHLCRAEAQMAGVGRMEAVFTGDRFLLGKKQSSREELFSPLRRLAMR